MGRAERRKEERQQARIDKQDKMAAAAMVERDFKRHGIYDAREMIRNEHYMEQVVSERIKQQRGWNQNGISLADVKAEFDRGYAAARRDITSFTMRMFYGALGIALHDLYGFGQERCARVFERVNQVMVEEICTEDITERLRREVGIDLVDTDLEI